MIKPIRAKWDSVMTDRERFNNQMHYRPVDRCFNMEFGYWKENFQQWPMFLENNITSNSQAELFFNFDEIHVIGTQTGMYPGFPEEVVSETAETRIIRRGGLLLEVLKSGNSSMPHFLRSSIVTPDDWLQVKRERFDRRDPARRADIPNLQAWHPRDRRYPLGINCGSMIGKVRNMLTFEGLAYAIYDYPDMVEDMVETHCQLVEDSLDQLLPHFEFDFAAGWEDICFKNGPIVSVDFFRDVVLPRYQRIHHKLRQFGIDLWYTDCDGDVRHILPLFLQGGINCLFPFEVASSAHPGELLEAYGRDLRIMGGVDKLQLGKGPQAISQYLETLIPLVKRGGYIPFCDHRCPPNVRPEDYLFYLDLKQTLFGVR